MEFDDGVWKLQRDSADFSPPAVPPALHGNLQRRRRDHRRRVGDLGRRRGLGARFLHHVLPPGSETRGRSAGRRLHDPLPEWQQAICREVREIITAGHDNKTARTVAFREGEAINRPALTAMFEEIIANNRAGGGELQRESG